MKPLPVPRSDEGVGHHEGDVVGVGPPAALDGDGDVAEGHGVVAHAHLGAFENKRQCLVR